MCTYIQVYININLFSYWRWRFPEMFFPYCSAFCIDWISSFLSSAVPQTAKHHSRFHSSRHFVSDDLGCAACGACVCICLIDELLVPGHWKLCVLYDWWSRSAVTHFFLCYPLLFLDLSFSSHFIVHVSMNVSWSWCWVPALLRLQQCLGH